MMQIWWILFLFEKIVKNHAEKPSGNLLQFANWKPWTIEIDDLPIINCDFPVRYVNVYWRVIVWFRTSTGNPWRFYL